MPRSANFAGVLDAFKPGRTIYIPGASGEIPGLAQLLAANPECLAGVTLVSCLLPGMNGFDYAALHPDCRLRTFLLSPALRGSFEAGRVEVLPLAYSDVATYLAELAPDVALLHLTMPEAGKCSFGLAADFGPLVARKAQFRIGILNRSMPRPLFGPTVALEDLERSVEIDEPIVSAPVVSPIAELEEIARRVATLVPNGAAIQSGIGQVPSALWRALKNHRALRLWSGMIGDGFLDAFDSGATTLGGHVAGIAFGGEALHRRLDRSDLVRFADAGETHSSGLKGIQQFFAVNSALEIDLLGQANLEWQQGRLISGAGGAPDFAAAARASPGGASIVALPSTARGGAVSRVVSLLNAPAVSLSRYGVDFIVTEYGIAALRGLNIDDRAEAVVRVAHPSHRTRLAAEWEAIRRNF